MALILVVDDHSSIRRLITLALEDRGHTCEEAANGTEAIECISRNHYDAVVLDLMMPVVDGFGVLESLNGSPPSPVLVLTATAQPGAAKEAMDAGATAVLRKPFDPDEIAVAIEALT